MLARSGSYAFLLALLATTSIGVVGCSATSEGDEEDTGALTDDESSGWTMDYAKMNAAFPDEAMPIREGHPEDAFSVLVDLGDKKLVARTHMFKETVNIIPYANPDVEAQVAQATGGHGDAIIAQYIKPREVGFMVKHHRPLHRVLALQGGGPEMKENFKLQDTHVGIILGVAREGGVAGAISVNNPKNYEQGAFGVDSYPMVFVKPVFPQGVDAAMAQLYQDNIRAMAVLFNTVSAFPGDYNGGDPLGARSPKEVQRHVAMMVKAISGDQAAQQWFTLPQNKIYCAELAHVSTSAGVLVPLRKKSIVGLEGDNGIVITDTDWDNFTRAVDAGWPYAEGPIPSSDGPPNPRLKDLKQYKPDWASLANLRPISEIAPAQRRADGVPAKGLAFEPMTMADIVQHFLRTHIPRDPALQKGTPLEGMAEQVAPMQAGVLAKMEDGLYDSMKVPPADQQGGEQRKRSLEQAQLMSLPANLAAGQQVRFTVKDVFDGIVATVGKSYGSYGEFQQAVQPWLMVARKVTGPRGDTGEGLFVPPSLLHTIAQGAHPGGFLGLKYLGHGLHFSLVKAPERSVTPAPAPGADNAPNGPNAQPFAPPPNNNNQQKQQQ